jgi:hypothetical protein
MPKLSAGWVGFLTQIKQRLCWTEGCLLVSNDLRRQLMQIAFTLFMIVLFPGGAPVVTNVGTWQKASDCGTAADGAFARKNIQGEQVPSISFVCVPRSGFGIRGMPIQP